MAPDQQAWGKILITLKLIKESSKKLKIAKEVAHKAVQ
jgi:hypothetical protein